MASEQVTSSSSSACLLGPAESVRLCFDCEISDCWTVGKSSPLLVALKTEAGVKICHPHSNHIWTDPESSIVRRGMSLGVPLEIKLEGRGAYRFLLRVGRCNDPPGAQEDGLNEHCREERLVLDLKTGLAQGFFFVVPAPIRCQQDQDHHEEAPTKTDDASAETTLPPARAAAVRAHLCHSDGLEMEATHEEECDCSGDIDSDSDIDSEEYVHHASLTLVIEFPAKWAERLNRPALSLRTLPVRVLAPRRGHLAPAEPPQTSLRYSSVVRHPRPFHGPWNVRRLRFSFSTLKIPTTNTKHKRNTDAKTVLLPTRRVERSGPLADEEEEKEEQEEIGGGEGAIAEFGSSSRLEMEPTTIELSVVESRYLGGYFGTVWDCSLVLASFLTTYVGPRMFEGKRVVEVGAGCGVVSTVCAALGAREMVATDSQGVLPLLRLNVERCSVDLGLRNLKVESYEWGTSPDFLGDERFDIILCSDLLYDPAHWSALRSSLSMLASEGSAVYFAHRTRNVQEEMFFDAWDKSSSSSGGGGGSGYSSSGDDSRGYRYRKLLFQAKIESEGGVERKPERSGTYNSRGSSDGSGCSSRVMFHKTGEVERDMFSDVAVYVLQF